VGHPLLPPRRPLLDGAVELPRGLARHGLQHSLGQEGCHGEEGVDIGGHGRKCRFHAADGGTWNIDGWGVEDVASAVGSPKVDAGTDGWLDLRSCNSGRKFHTLGGSDAIYGNTSTIGICGTTWDGGDIEVIIGVGDDMVMWGSDEDDEATNCGVVH